MSAIISYKRFFKGDVANRVTPMLDKAWARVVWNRLSKVFRHRLGEFVVDYVDTPFGVLVAIILSQNTSDKNSIRALKRLKEEIGVEPKSIARAPLDRIMEVIRVAGMYRQKAKTIKRLAELVLNGLDLDQILRMSLEEARARLLKIKGLGKKTVDVFLAIYGKRIMGVDTHARRIAKRWGIVDRDSYDDVQRVFVELFNFVENYDELHKMLILLGRKYCTARKPKCDECPIGDICPKVLE